MSQTPEIPVLYLDESLLVVDKPAGLPTLVDGYHPEALYLVGLLKATYGRVWTVHRLDRETSGVMIFARTEQAHRNLNAQFERRLANKKYHALVIGEPGWNEICVDLPLLVDGDRRHRSLVDHQRGKPAQTDLRVLERFVGYALVEATPHTGRTHQIRLHLAAVGHPLVADRLYGKRALQSLPGEPGKLRACPIKIGRVALHAFILILDHPSSGERVDFQAPYPSDFVNALKDL